MTTEDLKEDLKRVIIDSESLEEKMNDFLKDLDDSSNDELKTKIEEKISKNRKFIDNLKERLKDIE